MGIARFIPDPDASERFEVEVRAPAEIAFDVAERFDMQSIAIVRAIFWLRGALLGSRVRGGLGPRGLVAETSALGWRELERVPGRLLVMGAVTRPWEADVEFRGLPPEELVRFTEPGYVRIAWTIESEPLEDSRAVLRTETRAQATDADGRRRFRTYWRWARFGILPIRWLVLPAMRKEAERRARAGET